MPVVLTSAARVRLARMCQFGVPMVVLKLATLCHMAGLVDGLCILDAVEGFAGEAAITKSLRSHCLLAVAYDYKYDAVLQNILNPYTAFFYAGMKLFN